MQSLREEVADLEAHDAVQTALATQNAADLELQRELLATERERSAALCTALDESHASLEAAAARESQLKKDLEEERARSKRFAAARTDKEKQLAVVMSEKNRISSLLSKKDSLARDLTAKKDALERNIELTSAARAAQLQQRRIARAQAALAIGEAAAEQALPMPSAGEEEATPSLSARAGALSAKPVEEDRRLGSQPQRAPGAGKRFVGWQQASPAERDAALRNENAVLISVLAERDAALESADAELRKLRVEHAAMLTRWREGNKAARRRHVATPGGSAAATPGSSDSSPALHAKVHTPRTQSAPVAKKLFQTTPPAAPALKMAEGESPS